jgi:cytochrome c biogenesis protein ResB
VLDPMALAIGERQTVPGIDFSVGFRAVADYTVLIARKDPGQGIVWTAFGSLISGILITFYLPRRRVWARLGADGDLALVGRSDRYVDFEREFGRLLDDLVRARPASAPVATRGGATREGATQEGATREARPSTSHSAS